MITEAHTIYLCSGPGILLEFLMESLLTIRFSYVGYENESVDVYYASGESTSYNITNLLPFQIISVEISASTSVGEGPLTPEVEIQTAQARKIRIHDCKICT